MRKSQIAVHKITLHNATNNLQISTLKNMALDKSKLANAFELVFEAVSNKQINETQARKLIALEMAEAIDTFVRDGIVNTTGTATAQKGKMT